VLTLFKKITTIMNTNNTFFTRRQLLRHTWMGAALTQTVPGFIGSTFTALSQAAEATSSPRSGTDERILVVLQLAGGNDGLNTLVPYADDIYYQQRKSIALPKDDLLKLNDHLGLSPQLTAIKKLYDEGQVAIVQGVGYPNPNRSHFRSTEIWQAATDADRRSRTGWLGRYFDAACASTPQPMFGLCLGGETPESFQAETNPGIALSSPEIYRWIHQNGEATDENLSEIFDELNQPEENHVGGSVAQLMTSGGAKKTELATTSPLQFLERTALDARLSSSQVRQITKKHQKPAGYPAGNRLAQQFSLVSRFICGGLPTRVYYVSHGGFDTHNNQGGLKGAHQNLLKQMDEAIGAFYADLKSQGLDRQVTLMTFSEFGRRVAQNGSNGTDHGTAAPLFVVGPGVKGGLYGATPSLSDLDQGDLKHTTDFRSVYATVLQSWLKTPAETILQRHFSPLPLFA
jgi:uncharacterized protein (DUF1501 family)